MCSMKDTVMAFRTTTRRLENVEVIICTSSLYYVILGIFFSLFLVSLRNLRFEHLETGCGDASFS